MSKQDPQNCPKCDKPSIARRAIRGTPNLICSNAHNWPVGTPAPKDPHPANDAERDASGLSANDRFIRGDASPYDPGGHPYYEVYPGDRTNEQPAKGVFEITAQVQGREPECTSVTWEEVRQLNLDGAEAYIVTEQYNGTLKYLGCGELHCPICHIAECLVRFDLLLDHAVLAEAHKSFLAQMRIVTGPSICPHCGRPSCGQQLTRGRPSAFFCQLGHQWPVRALFTSASRRDGQ